MQQNMETSNMVNFWQDGINLNWIPKLLTETNYKTQLLKRVNFLWILISLVLADWSQPDQQF